MRLYSRTNASAVTREGVLYVPVDDGGFDFPDELAHAGIPGVVPPDA
jgi:hypothetical protein